MVDHNRRFKELLTTFFAEFIDLFFPQVAAYLEADSLVFLDKEVFTGRTYTKPRSESYPSQNGRQLWRL